MKTLFFFFLNIFSGFSLRDKASILMYHSVGKNSAFSTVSLENFEKQFLYLKKRKFNLIKLSELINRMNSGMSISNCVSLTFDDGYKDNFTLAYPLFKKYKIPTSIFIATSYIGKTMTNSEGIELSMLSETEIKNMNNDELVEFLPHTHTHKNLPDCDVSEIENELEHSTQIINRIIGKQTPLILAYPKGKYSKFVVDILKSKRWLGAVTVKPGLVDQKTDPYILPRNSVDSTTSFAEFKAKLSKSIIWYEAIKRKLW